MRRTKRLYSRATWTPETEQWFELLLQVVEPKSAFTSEDVARAIASFAAKEEREDAQRREEAAASREEDEQNDAEPGAAAAERVQEPAQAASGLDAVDMPSPRKRSVSGASWGRPASQASGPARRSTGGLGAPHSTTPRRLSASPPGNAMVSQVVDARVNFSRAATPAAAPSPPAPTFVDAAAAVAAGSSPTAGGHHRLRAGPHTGRRASTRQGGRVSGGRRGRTSSSGGPGMDDARSDSDGGGGGGDPLATRTRYREAGARRGSAAAAAARAARAAEAEAAELEAEADAAAAAAAIARRAGYRRYGGRANLNVPAYEAQRRPYPPRAVHPPSVDGAVAAVAAAWRPVRRSGPQSWVVAPSAHDTVGRRLRDFTFSLGAVDALQECACEVISVGASAAEVLTPGAKAVLSAADVLHALRAIGFVDIAAAAAVSVEQWRAAERAQTDAAAVAAAAERAAEQAGAEAGTGAPDDAKALAGLTQ